MDEHEPELTESERLALEAWTALTPPAGFAAKVLAAREVPVAAAPRRRWPYVAAAVAAAASVAVVLVALRPASQAATGSLVASERTEAALGRRAVAVAEAAAELRWQIDRDGAATVEHTAGNVFYRVDRGGPFVVHTPAGDIRVTGTCFRIEVTPMNKKHVVLSGVAGAALAAAVVVTVYEGHVVADTKAARTELVAGSQATIGADGRATVARLGPGELEAGAAVRSLAEDQRASREELVARAGEQRAEIAKLRRRVADLERGGASRPGRAPDNSAEEGRAWYDPSPERLAQWATECHIRADTPGYDRYSPLPAAAAGDHGLEPSEVAPMNAATGEIYQQWKQLLRALYIEATGDLAGADNLSLEAMRGEIQEKSPPGEHNRLLRQISNERAGLASPPADLAKTSPLERMMRAQLALGDQTEAAIAKRLGAARAKEIRGDGWSSRSDWSGCPGGR